MNMSFILVAISACALPALAVTAMLLRRNIVQGKWKVFFLTLGLVLLSFAVYDAFKEHQETLGFKDVIVSGVTAAITIFILSHFTHGHSHKTELEGAKGIVISEAFHSLIDGAVIGATYIVSPILGYAATIGILTHEMPKILGTITLFRSLGMSVKKTILYGIMAQIGSPVSAILIFMLGKQINEDNFRALEIASVSSLAAIVLWIIYLEIRFHVKHKEEHHNH